MTPLSDRRNLPLLIALGAAALLVAISLIVVLTRGAPVAMHPDSPEGVVQRYAQAVIDDDLHTARGLLAPSRAAQCEEMTPEPDPGIRLTLVRTDERENTATVHVEMSVSSGNGLFGPSDSVWRESFDLERTPEGWGITRAPWQFMVCTEGEK